MMKNAVSPTIRLLLGMSLCSLGGAMLYLYFKNRDEDDEGLGTTVVSKMTKNIQQKEVTVEIVVSNEHIPVLVGRNGANLKIVEEKTKTLLRFREKDDSHQFCDIRGLPENVKAAKEMLMKEIQRSATVTEEIHVPQLVISKIINHGSLQEICRQSFAKVSVDSGDRSSGQTTRRIVITGNRNQVNIAKKLIEESLGNLEQEHKREPRRSPTNSVSSINSSMTSLNSHLPPKMYMSETEKPMEIFVSAVASPAKFWLQLIGPQTRKLDELVGNMTEYYNNIENQKNHKIADPYLGQIVAALFKYDGKWYRAEIIGILPNEYNPRDVILDLYFVDYGDSEYISPNEVFELRTDFLTLRFQAIECYLAHVKPTSSTDPDIWDKQAIAKFEEITQVASWKKLISKVVTYKERPKGGNHIRREGSPVPGVELFDPSEGADVGHLLILNGFAEIDYPETTNDNRPDTLDMENSKSNNNTPNEHNDFNLTNNNNIDHNAESNINGNNDLLISSLQPPSSLNLQNGNHKKSVELFYKSEQSNGNSPEGITDNDLWDNFN